MNRIARVLHTARTHATGARERGASRNSDGRLDIRLSSPGSARIGANPEQLAGRRPSKGRSPLWPDDYFLSTRLDISLPGIDQDTAQALVNEAHEICPSAKQRAATLKLPLT